MPYCALVTGGFVLNYDVTSAAVLPDVDGEEPELKEGWDRINI